MTRLVIAPRSHGEVDVLRDSASADPGGRIARQDEVVDAPGRPASGGPRIALSFEKCVGSGDPVGFEETAEPCSVVVLALRAVRANAR
eukprot:3886836-Heterocapsa_arctica.AAC.1